MIQWIQDLGKMLTIPILNMLDMILLSLFSIYWQGPGGRFFFCKVQSAPRFSDKNWNSKNFFGWESPKELRSFTGQTRMAWDSPHSLTSVGSGSKGEERRQGENTGTTGRGTEWGNSSQEADMGNARRQRSLASLVKCLQAFLFRCLLENRTE